MIGCVLLGAAGLIAAAKLFHHGRMCGMGGGGCGGRGRWRRFGHGPWGGYGHHGHWEGANDGWDDDFGHGHFAGGGGFGPRFFLRALAERLEATPAQERVIRDAVNELRESGAKLRGEGRKTRADVAAAFRKPQFDEVLFGELYARHDRTLEDLRKAFVGAGARIHDALDERQRARLADLIEAGPGAWRRPRFGGGRGPWAEEGRGW
jgi:hypothetical protein